MAYSKTQILSADALLNPTQLSATDGEGERRVGRSPHRLRHKEEWSNIAIAAELNNEPVSVLLHDDPDNTPHLESIVEYHDVEHPQTPQKRIIASAATPPIPIDMTPSASRSHSRMRDVGNDADMIENTLRPSQLTGKERRKKKKHHKKNAARVASGEARLFDLTPAASGDEDSDFATHFVKRDLSAGPSTAATNSPYMRPTSSCGGISALRQQLELLELEPVPRMPSIIRQKSKLGSHSPSSNSATSDRGNDTDNTEMTSYEVNLEHDFVSCDVEDQAKSISPDAMEMDEMHRKMTATDFEPITCLGKGSYGTVHLVKQKATGRLYAQKQFRKASLTVHKKLVEQTKTERTILESINRHAFVVKLYYAFQDQEKLYLILEYAQGGELFTYLQTERMFSEDTAMFYMAEMVLALEHLHHTVGVLYRDLKPENCLLDSEGHLLLTDFGLSKVAVDSERCNSVLGTIEYMAPEVILGQFYGTAVDWWSFGALSFDLLTGSPPFRGGNHAKIQEKIVKQKLVLPYFLGPDSKDLLTRLLRKEPNKRLGGNMPKDMALIKGHRFFRKMDWKALAARELEPPIKPLITNPELAENFSHDFTDLPLSPVLGHFGKEPWSGGHENPFGGFSYVASKSLFMDSFLAGREDDEEEGSVGMVEA